VVSWIRVGHNLLVSHAHTVDLYRTVFKPKQNGRIGITLNVGWTIPYDESPESMRFLSSFHFLISEAELAF
jgi:beta-glucosidase